MGALGKAADPGAGWCRTVITNFGHARNMGMCIYSVNTSEATEDRSTRHR
jgi:hypothetical protein